MVTSAPAVVTSAPAVVTSAGALSSDESADVAPVTSAAGVANAIVAAPSEAAEPAAPASPVEPPASVPDASALFAVDLAGGDRELTEPQIAECIARGEVHESTLVWRDGMPEWLELKNVPELARHLKPAKPVEPAPPAAKPAAAPSPAAATARFRPRQATIPMGMLPDQQLVQQAKELAKANKPETTPERGAPLSPRPAPPAPRDRSTAQTAPGTPEAKLPASLKDTPKVGTKAPTPVRPPVVPDLSDEEPTIMRPSPFADLEATPGPLPGPARDPLPRPPPSAPSAASSPWAAAAAELLKPPAPKAPPSATESAVPMDTYRATPEAKKSWFPEAEQPEGPLPSSPFPVGAPRAPAPSAPFGAVSSPFGAAAGFGTPPAAPAPVPGAQASSTQAALSFDDKTTFEPRGNKKQLIIALVVLVLVIAAIAVAILTSGGGSSPVPPAAAPTAETQAANPAGAAPVAAPVTPSSESGVAEATAGIAATVDGQAERPGGKGPNGGFADLFAEGAKHAATDGSGKFDPAAARTAIEDQLPEAARCREPGGPTGMTDVSVTFAPNGSVSSALITEPPFANTSVGTCIMKALKRARIKPFSGASASVSQRISIR